MAKDIVSIFTSEAKEMQGIERKKEKDIDDIFRDGKLRSLSFVFLKKCDVALTNGRKVLEPLFHRRLDRSSVVEDASATHSQRGGVSFAGAVSGTMARR